jgi:hypothetical protein
MSGRIVSLARKPWGSSSRSPSPSAKRSKQQEQSPTRSGRKTDDDPSQPSRRRTILYKRPRRPMVAVVAKGPEDSPSSPSSPSGNSLRHKSSFEKFTASLSVSTPVLPPMPKGAAETAAAYANSGGDHSRKKDELWGVFRGLEADYQKYVQPAYSLLQLLTISQVPIQIDLPESERYPVFTPPFPRSSSSTRVLQGPPTRGLGPASQYSQQVVDWNAGDAQWQA